MPAEQEARRVTRDPGPDHAALLAIFDGQVVGLASYEVAKNAPAWAGRTAEVAFAVADTMHHRGIATLLLEHLVSLARGQAARGAHRGDAAGEHEHAPGLLRRGPAGREQARGRRGRHHDPAAARRRRPPARGLPGHGRGAGAVGQRGQPPAGVRARRRSRSSGRAGDRDGWPVVLDNIRAGGYAGQLYAVNPQRAGGRRRSLLPRCRQPAGGPRPRGARRSAAAVVDTAEACGRRGVRGLVVLTSAIDAPASADLLAACRRHGMRLIGPNCFGIAVPSIGLDATFAAANPAAGSVGPGHAVRRHRLRDGGPPHPARDRDLLVRLGRQQARRIEQRPAAVVGAGRADTGRRALHRVVRQPAQVRPDRAPGRR